MHACRKMGIIIRYTNAGAAFRVSSSSQALVDIMPPPMCSRAMATSAAIAVAASSPHPTCPRSCSTCHCRY